MALTFLNKKKNSITVSVTNIQLMFLSNKQIGRCFPRGIGNQNVQRRKGHEQINVIKPGSATHMPLKQEIFVLNFGIRHGELYAFLLEMLLLFTFVFNYISRFFIVNV